MKTEKTITILLPNRWKSLIPPLQHTLIGDVVISNQFDSLTKIDKDGGIVPNAALSWEVSPDYKRVTYKIDTSKKFSNGTELKAIHFKKAWEHGLTLSPFSQNESTKDGMYLIKGYDQFPKTGELSGVKILGDDTLEVEFVESFRSVLAQLSGARFAAYIVNGNNYIGTGRYIIHQVDHKDELSLEINKFHNDAEKLTKIQIIGIENAYDSIKMIAEKKADVFIAAGYLDAAQAKNFSDLLVLNTGPSSHAALMVSNRPHSLFAKKEYRQAFQALLLLKKIRLYPDYFYDNSFYHDPQSFLPFQTGRIEDSEAKNLIREGEKYIPAFLEANKKKPLYFIESLEGSPLKKTLLSLGLNLTKESGQIPFNKMIDMAYKSEKADLILVSFSIINNDPDGVYHLLGKNGAISLPMIYNENINRLLTKGRNLFIKDEMQSLYKEVNRSILEEVPYIHIGYLHSLTIFNKETIEAPLNFHLGNDASFHLFKKK